MDKNTVTGLILMGLVVVVFTWLGRPSQEELALQQRYNDSIAAVQNAEQERIARERNQLEATESITANDSLTVRQKDSISALQKAQAYGAFASATSGEDETYGLANDSVSFEISSHGAMVKSSELPNYKDFLGQPVKLFRPNDSEMNITFVTTSNRVISTKDLYFKGEMVSPTSLSLTATAENGGTLTFLYTLEDKYILDLQIITNEAFRSLITPGSRFLDAGMHLPSYQNEKSLKSEQHYSGLAYQRADGKVEKMSTSKSDTETLSGSLKWIGFRDMFFSTIVYAPKGLESVEVGQEMMKDTQPGGILKKMNAKFTLPISDAAPISLKIYSGPNDYALLSKLDKAMGNDTRFAQVVDMGDWFRVINVWLIIPIFNFLERFFTNYGVIILLLTLIIKLILSPFTFKSYESQAKMRVLKPQVDEINKKYEGDDKMMERQKATMELYSRAGVSTMGGCLPMLLQMPFLIAMYQYFPTSINLRGQSFLWANDLSTYDDVIR